jgi:hypothetical protein
MLCILYESQRMRQKKEVGQEPNTPCHCGVESFVSIVRNGKKSYLCYEHAMELFEKGKKYEQAKKRNGRT